ncbi:MAG: hypothetical protein KAS86_04860 [Candidatus Omnitrophica bacterium]|nr:hypothetical protein [Candidatus Omnitrophota bacterium]
MKFLTSGIRTDPENRLIISDQFDTASEFSAREAGRSARGSSKSLITGPAGKKRLAKLTVEGTWALTPEHDLKLRVSGSSRPLSGKTIIFRGHIEHAKGDSLTFRIREYENILGIRSGTISLKGRWRADRYNRITFEVRKGKGRYDTLTFQGAWNVTKSNELIYKYRKTRLKTKEREEKTLIFRGYWQLGKGRLLYRLERSSDSFFSFKASFRSGALSSNDRTMRYTVGITYSKGKVFRKVRETVTIYGNWRLARDLKVWFEVTYSGGRRKKIEFGLEKLIRKGSSINLFLRDKSGGNLGISVEFLKTFRNDAEFFLALSRAGKESSILGGVTVKF